MAQIKPETVLKLERVRQKAVQDLRNKNIYIDENADINEAYQKYKSLNNSAQLLDGSIGEVVRDDNITGLKNSALAYCPNLKKAYFKNVVRTNDYIISNCPLLEHIELPNAEYVGLLFGYGGGNGVLRTLYFPKMLSGFGNQMMRSTVNIISKIITPKAVYNFSSVHQYGTHTYLKLIDSSIVNFSTPAVALFSNLEALILRGDELPTLASTSFFTNPNLKIYIKSEFVEDLKAATNWSALPCMANEDAVVPLETSEYADERWFEQTDEFKLNYIYQDLEDEQEDEQEETNGGETP